MSFEVVAFRASDYETPLWSFPNLSAGRYNAVGSRATQYLSLHPMGPWAEMIRTLDLREQLGAATFATQVWAVRLQLAEDPFEVTFGSAALSGLAPRDLVDDDLAPTQRLAEELAANGVRAVIVPSAALPGTRNLVVMAPAVIVDYHADPIDPSYEWPSSQVARHGHPPDALRASVHYRSATDAHPALAAWMAGDEFLFQQPAAGTL